LRVEQLANTCNRLFMIHQVAGSISDFAYYQIILMLVNTFIE